MSISFIFPTEVTDLEASSSEYLHVQNRVLVEHRSEKELIRSIYEYRDRFDSNGGSVLQCQQDCFDQLYSLTQDHAHLGLEGRKYLWEQLQVISVHLIADLSNRNVVESLDRDEQGTSVCVQVFLLCNIITQVHIENQRELIKATTLTKGGKKVNKKVTSEYDYVLAMERYCSLLADLVGDSHLSVAFPSGVPPVNLGMYACKTVCTLMSFNDYMKGAGLMGLKSALVSVFAHCNGLYSVSHETEHFLSRVLIDNTYTPSALADVFKAAVRMYAGTKATNVLFGTLSVLQIGDNLNVSQLPEFFEELAKKQPVECFENIHLLLPQISNSHHSVRLGMCALVKVVLLKCFGAEGVNIVAKLKAEAEGKGKSRRKESLLKKKLDNDDDDDDDAEEEEETNDENEDEENENTVVKSENNSTPSSTTNNALTYTFLELYEILLRRSEDVYFTTRTQVLQCTTEQVQYQQLPLSAYRMALNVSLHRLRDKTVSVRKHALVLAGALIEQFPGTSDTGQSIQRIAQSFESKKILGTSKEAEMETCRVVISQLEQGLIEQQAKIGGQDQYSAAATSNNRRQTMSVNPEVVRLRKEVSKVESKLQESKDTQDAATVIVEKTHSEMQAMREHYQFAVLQKQCMDLCKELLGSVVQSDINEAIHLASLMLEAGVDQSEGQIKMILTLVCHKDPVIKSQAVNAASARLIGKVNTAKDALAAVLNLMKYNGAEGQSGGGDGAGNSGHRTTVTDALSMQEQLTCQVKAGQQPREVVHTCWELTTQYLGQDKGQALLSTTDRANALSVLRMCAEGNPNIVLDGIANLVKLCQFAATKTDPGLVQQVAGMLGRLEPVHHADISLRDRTFFAAFLVDALTHGCKFIVCPGQYSYFTDDAELRAEHLNSTTRSTGLQSHLLRLQNGCSNLNSEELRLLVPFKPQHAFIATHRQKARIEAWFSMASECVQAIEALSPTVSNDFTFVVQALLSQAMQLQAIQAHGSEEQAHQILSLSNQKLSQNYLNSVFHTASEEIPFCPVENDQMGNLSLCTSFLLRNTPHSWLPHPFLAFAQSHKDEALCFKNMFTPIAYVPSMPNPGYKNSGCTIEGYATDVGVRPIPSSTQLSRALFIAGRAATYYLQQLHVEEKRMRESITEGLKKVQNKRHDENMRDKNKNKQAEKKAEDDEDATLEAELIAQHDQQIEKLKETTLFKTITDSGDELLAVLLATARRVLMYSGKFPAKSLQRAAAEALVRFMMLHREVCADNLQLLISVLRSSKDEVLICNIIVGLADLAARHPNEVQRYNSYLYSCLHHTNPNVRVYAITTVSYLVLNDVHKTKEPAAGIAVCLVDNNTRIRDLAQLFFESLSRKTNAVYNPILNSVPDIISSLTHKYRVSSSNYDAIMRYLFNQSNNFFKEAECDILVEKLCRRFQSIAQDMTGEVVLEEVSETQSDDSALKPYRTQLETIDFDSYEFAVNLDIALTQRGGMHCVCLMEEGMRICVCNIVELSVQLISTSEALAVQQLRIANARDTLQEKGILHSHMTSEDKHQRYCQSIANVLPILGFGAAGLKKLIDLRQCYWNLLWDDQIYTKLKLTLKNLSKKLSSSKKDMKEDISAFEAAMDEEHAKLKEDRTLLRKGKLHMQQGVLQKVRANVANISALQKLTSTHATPTTTTTSSSKTRGKKIKEEELKSRKKPTAKKQAHQSEDDEAPPRSRRTTARATVKKEPVYEDDDDDDDDNDNSEETEESSPPPPPPPKNKKKPAATKKEYDSDSDHAPRSRKNKRKVVDSEDESD